MSGIGIVILYRQMEHNRIKKERFLQEKIEREYKNENKNEPIKEINKNTSWLSYFYFYKNTNTKIKKIT